MAVNKDNPLPLYYQIKEDIKAKIHNKEYRVGDKIPSEASLMELYGASRMTVRNAVVCLVNEGFVTKSQGQGTYIKRPKATQQFNRITGWAETMKALGREVTSELIQAISVEADDAIAGFGIEKGTPMYLVERVRYCDGEPMAIIRNHIVQSAAPGLPETIVGVASLYALLENRYHVVFDTAKEIVGARGALPEEAKLLNIKKGAPVVINKRIVYDEHEKPFEMDYTVNRADGYEVSFMMKGRP
jgi:GntR family transcriptional regulator